MQTFYFRTVAGLLWATGLIKLISAFGSARLLTEQDSIFDVKNTYLLGFTGSLEILIGIILISKLDLLFRRLVLVWLTACLVLYRVGLWWLNVAQPCPCLGNITGWLGISRRTADLLATSILVYLLVGSLVILLRPAVRRKVTSATA